MKKSLESLAILTIATLIIAGCGGGGGGGGGGISVSLSPSSATIQPNASLNLTATVAGAGDSAVSWTHNGGDLMILGNIGTFTAPAAEGTYTVTATSAEDSSKSATAQIVVSNSAPGGNVSISIWPSDIELSPGDFIDLTATVTGNSNTAVTWSASGGTLTPSGNTARFTAPSTKGTYTVAATSVADPTASAAVQILVSSGLPPPPPIL